MSNDPNSERDRLLQAGISAVKARRFDEARDLLRQTLAIDSNNETAWLWLAASVETVAVRKTYLERALSINPNNVSARRALERLTAETDRAKRETQGDPPTESLLDLGSAEQSLPPEVPGSDQAGGPPIPPVSPPSAQGIDLPPLGTLNGPPDDASGKRRRSPGIGVILLIVGIIVVLVVVILVFFNGSTGSQTGGTAVAGQINVTSAASLSFIQLQQTRDAQTLTPNSPLTAVVTPVSQLLPPTWTLEPSATILASATPPVVPTLGTPTASPTLPPLTATVTLAPVTSPTNTTTPPGLAALTIGFAEETKDHPAVRALVQIQADGKQRKSITDGTATAMDPAWSRDGKQVAYVTLVNGLPQLAIADAGGTHAQVVTKLNGSSLRSPSWSPDGKQIAFSASVADAKDDSTAIYLLQVADSSLKTLSDPKTSLYAAQHPTWSPDGSQIAFAGSVSRYDPFQIDVITLATGQSTSLTDTSLSAVQPAWSPTNNQIVFTAIRDGHAALEMINADGSAPQILTADAPNTENRDPAWSQDGHWLAFASSRDGGFTIYVGLVNQGALSNTARLTDPAQASYTPAFRPAQ